MFEWKRQNNFLNYGWDIFISQGLTEDGFMDKKIDFEDEYNRFLRVRKYDYYFILGSSIPSITRTNLLSSHASSHTIQGHVVRAI